MNARFPALAALILGSALTAEASAIAASAPQVPCTGWSLDNEVQPYGLSQNAIGTNGDLVASYVVLDATSSLGGVSIHRVLPDGGGVTLVDSFAQTGLGPGFAAYVFGCAVSDDNVVLLARKRALPLPIDLIQLRRNGTVWTASSMPATAASSAQKSRHFHSDGNTAVVAGITPAGQNRIVVDFLAVDPATGDWFVEDTARGGSALFGYLIGDVSVRGHQAVVQSFNARRALAWERTATGRWLEVALPVDVVGPASDMLRLVLADDTLVSLHGPYDAPRLEIRERGPQGQWTLMNVTPIASAPIEGGLQLHVAGERIALQAHGLGFEVYRRTSPSTLALESTVDGSAILRLGEDYAAAIVTSNQQFEVNVLPLDELTTGLMPCITAGQNVCTNQTGGALRYLPAAVGTPSAMDQVLLTDSAPNSFAVLFGQRGFFEPIQPTVSDLCLGGISPRVSVLPIRTGQDGSGIWDLDPANLMGPFGTVSFVGSTVAFQALVRTPLGVASTEAVWVQL